MKNKRNKKVLGLFWTLLARTINNLHKNTRAFFHEIGDE
jgi:hypothetical protein